MRGTEFVNEGMKQDNGITPADAGNSCEASMHQSDCQDHPRGCGEQLQAENNHH